MVHVVCQHKSMLCPLNYFTAFPNIVSVFVFVLCGVCLLCKRSFRHSSVIGSCRLWNLPVLQSSDAVETVVCYQKSCTLGGWTDNFAQKCNTIEFTFQPPMKRCFSAFAVFYWSILLCWNAHRICTFLIIFIALSLFALESPIIFEFCDWFFFFFSSFSVLWTVDFKIYP